VDPVDGPAERMVLEPEKRRGVAVGLEPDVAAPATVAPVRAPLGHMGFTPKRDTPRPAVAGFDVDLSFVDES
jgi:hypothetical protein